MDDETVGAIVHSQKIARKIGHSQMAVEVYGWAIKHAMVIPAAPLKDLMDMVSKEPA